MIFTVQFKNIILMLVISAFAACAAGLIIYFVNYDKYYDTTVVTTDNVKEEKKHIKWVDFNVPYGVMERALNIDIKSQDTEVKFDWIEIMSYLSAKCGGNYSSYKKSDFDKLEERVKAGEKIVDIGKELKLFSYYMEAYTAIFKEFVGQHKMQTEEEGKKVWKDKYGLKVFSPIARGYSFSHYDDFGNGRSFGYKRKHLGNDLMGSIGTPIIAIESGTVEAIGWNIYGGWRLGIRSFDKKRYYYYAHLKKDHPFHKELVEGQIVKAGDVIGYLGMTGYSRKENVNNINVPHLHFGLQLIFDESQKEGINQIWIDVYNIIELLQKNKSAVYRDSATQDFYRLYDIHDPSIPD